MVPATPIEVRAKRRESVDLSAYRKHDSLIGAWQVGSTLVAYVLCWSLMIASAQSHLLFPLTIVAAGLLVRLFVLQHDCGHCSLFESARANDIVGSSRRTHVHAVLSVAPYARASSQDERQIRSTRRNPRYLHDDRR